jgi:hypothetical protein
MKRAVIFSIFLFMAVSCSQASLPSAKLDWKSSSRDNVPGKTYVNEDFHFSVQYPDNWTLVDESYDSAGIRFLGFRVLSPYRNDLPGANGKLASFDELICYDTLQRRFDNSCYGEEVESVSFDLPGHPGDLCGAAGRELDCLCFGNRARRQMVAHDSGLSRLASLGDCPVGA